MPPTPVESVIVPRTALELASRTAMPGRERTRTRRPSGVAATASGPFPTGTVTGAPSANGSAGAGAGAPAAGCRATSVTASATTTARAIPQATQIQRTADVIRCTSGVRGRVDDQDGVVLRGGGEERAPVR